MVASAQQRTTEAIGASNHKTVGDAVMEPSTAFQVEAGPQEARLAAIHVNDQQAGPGAEPNFQSARRAAIDIELTAPRKDVVSQRNRGSRRRSSGGKGAGQLVNF